MQFMLIIVQSEDADLLCKRLNHEGLRLTRLETIGGFLSRGNVTVLMGVEESQIEGVLSIIRRTCHTRKRYINPLPTGSEPAHLTMAAPAYPMEVQVGGTVFTFPVVRFARLAAGGGDQVFMGSARAGQSSRGGAMHLVLTIVTSEDAESVTRALISENYRVTRMNTAGGFFRKRNVTLLVGCDEAQIDDVLRLIKENCRPRSEANPVEAGMPMYGATVFVLEADRFTRV
jgi:uncharacterized protein YaaQ